MDEDILTLVGQISTPGFFITAEVIKSSRENPEGLEIFVLEKLSKIQEGISGRKFTFTANGWRIIFTFFPTNQVVDKRYGLMNKMIKERKKVH